MDGFERSLRNISCSLLELNSVRDLVTTTGVREYPRIEEVCWCVESSLMSSLYPDRFVCHRVFVCPLPLLLRINDRSLSGFLTNSGWVGPGLRRPLLGFRDRESDNRWRETPSIYSGRYGVFPLLCVKDRDYVVQIIQR